MRRVWVLGAVIVAAVLVPAAVGAEGEPRPTNWLGEPAPTFDPGAPTPEGPVPTITVVPDTNLVDGQVVLVTGAGFAPDEPVLIFQCRDGVPPEEGCPPFNLAVAFADGAGAFEADVRVRAVPSPFFAPFDCRAVACNLTARSLALGSAPASAPISFDPNSPLVPAPVMTVTPSSGLAETQVVDVDITGFFPDQEIAIGECIDDVNGVLCGDFFELRTADANGEVHTTFEVRRSFEVGLAEPVDCLETQCFLATGGVLDEQPTETVNLSFAAVVTPITQQPSFAG